jgi:hypothetical protein
MTTNKSPNNVSKRYGEPDADADAMKFTNADWEARFAVVEEFRNEVAEPAAATDLSKYIDHTLLKLDATEAEIDELCAEARKHNFAVYPLTVKCPHTIS